MVELSTGDTAFILVCGGLVNLMTPGLAFFYGGLVRHTNTLTMMSQSFVSMGITSVLWVLVLFSLCFAKSWDPVGVIGNPFTFMGFQNVAAGQPLSQADSDSGGSTALIPGMLFAFYQAMFAVITPALMTGAFADRLHYVPWLIFLILWQFLVYAPWCHLIWGGGYYMEHGVWDFAGGIVVHTTAGFSALACIVVLGKRELASGQSKEDLDNPHNIPFVFLGTALLWFGWFGFNCGSALASNGVATLAGWNSQIAAAGAMLVWTLLDWYFKAKPGLISKCVGAIAGLATVTPAAGYIQPGMAVLLGLMAAPVCYSCVALLNRFGIDDALDVWGVHGMGGFLGTCMVGLMADGPECATLVDAPTHCVNPGTVTRSVGQFWTQLKVASICAAYSFTVSYILMKVMMRTRMRVAVAQREQCNLDVHIHGERAYSDRTLTLSPRGDKAAALKINGDHTDSDSSSEGNDSDCLC